MSTKLSNGFGQIWLDKVEMPLAYCAPLVRKVRV
jgi:hypothetical protein